MESLENYFDLFRKNIIGYNQSFDGPYGPRNIIYADWTASGRLYRPIEEKISEEIGCFVANTHTETNTTGTLMTRAYHTAREIIKRHVGAKPEDVLISNYSGMTGVVNKFQRILGLRVHESFLPLIQMKEEDRPIILVSHMEHHSNQTSWIETLGQVEIIPPDESGLPDMNVLDQLLERYQNRKMKIAAITSCSNVTGLNTPYHLIAKKMHQHGGYCFVDFACSAPYIEINMHPEDKMEYLDAIFFSPHKFLGGPGSSGVLIFNSALYHNRVPDQPGGGTVDWTNPWGQHKYIDTIEEREDGGTPAFLQTIKVALAIQLKELMGVSKMMAREDEQLNILWPYLDRAPHLHILAGQHRERLGIISFYIEGLHYNLGVRLLNDRFGIQTRGGCSCAGTYGHYLLNVSRETSDKITCRISAGDLTEKPGWIRLSIHPVMTNEEIEMIGESIYELAQQWKTWARDYQYDSHTNQFRHQTFANVEHQMVESWFQAEQISIQT